eukprot:TRINITY_DN13998_c0_g1_i1.p1 TRINITY_DN13998_c0_g1~~TRINITY_DN13998_c0_g1_i1.p1  ORF type:complete len:459 (+),score=149.83 TRINITY_DN13998_c0_g1_i1:74-1450(+)
MAGQEEQLHDVFALIDEDSGGTISAAEVDKFVAAFPEPPEAGVVEQLVREVDSDGSGDISVAEFCGVVDRLQSLTGLSVPEMLAHFQRRCYHNLFTMLKDDDVDYVSKNDLRKLIESLGETKLSSQDLLDLFARYDEDQSGQIELDEFIGIIGRVGEGMPISQLVHRFKEEIERRRAKMASILSRFGAPPAEGKPALRKRRKSTVHGASVKDLQRQLEEAQRALAEAQGDASDARAAASIATVERGEALGALAAAEGQLDAARQDAAELQAQLAAAAASGSAEDCARCAAREAAEAAARGAEASSAAECESLREQLRQAAAQRDAECEELRELLRQTAAERDAAAARLEAAPDADAVQQLCRALAAARAENSAAAQRSARRDEATAAVVRRLRRELDVLRQLRSGLHAEARAALDLAAATARCGARAAEKAMSPPSGPNWAPVWAPSARPESPPAAAL